MKKDEAAGPGYAGQTRSRDLTKVTMTSDDGTKQEFYVEAKARLNETDYLLVSDGDPEEAGALILKDISKETGEEAEYALVEDETEIRALLNVFGEILDGEADVTY